MVDMPLYGREVMIRVPDENNLLLGEKVVIAEKSKMPKILKNSAIQGGQE
jgi:HlyD family secretion protein